MPDFEAFWRETLQAGFTPVRPPERLAALPEPALPDTGVLETDRTPAPGTFEIAFAPDPSTWDGRFAENAWLQELPRPLSKEVWGNAAWLAPADASARGIADGDVVVVVVGAGRIELPALMMPGRAAGTIGLSLGNGRTTGVIAQSIGCDVQVLRTSDALWSRLDARLAKFGKHIELARTQVHRSMEGRDIVRTTTIAALDAAASTRAPGKEPDPAHKHVSLYPEFPRGRHAWAMVIDQSVCARVRSSSGSPAGQQLGKAALGHVRARRGCRLSHTVSSKATVRSTSREQRRGFHNRPEDASYHLDSSMAGRPE